MTKRNESIPILAMELPQSRGALPGFELAATKVVNIAANQVTSSLRETIRNVALALSESANEAGNFTLDEFSFSIAIDASGNVGLSSLAAANLGAEATISLTFKRKDRKD